jgi:N-acetyl-gamma-glutamyl-phosphate reductase
VSREGRRIEALYPNFLKGISAGLERPEAVVDASDLVFSALPHGVGEDYGKRCGDRGIPFIDLSADFRFDGDEETFTAWYGKPYRYPELRERSVYGLPELNRRRIRDLAARGPVIIGNPGCYPTAASLGVFPALERGLAGPGPVIVDAASGISGGGRDAAPAFHYPECADSVAPYKVGSHRHSPEISRNFRMMAARGGREGPSLIFTPHLAPMIRGILATIYVPLAEAGGGPPLPPRPPSARIEKRGAEIRDLYAEFYREEPFVRVLPYGSIAASGRVRQSNFCDISVHLDAAGTTLIIISAIDNMVKGAAGQAVQNMNIIFGFEETAGLGALPAAV